MEIISMWNFPLKYCPYDKQGLQHHGKLKNWQNHFPDLENAWNLKKRPKSWKKLCRDLLCQVHVFTVGIFR